MKRNKIITLGVAAALSFSAIAGSIALYSKIDDPIKGDINIGDITAVGGFQLSTDTTKVSLISPENKINTYSHAFTFDDGAVPGYKQNYVFGHLLLTVTVNTPKTTYDEHKEVLNITPSITGFTGLYDEDIKNVIKSPVITEIGNETKQTKLTYDFGELPIVKDAYKVTAPQKLDLTLGFSDKGLTMDPYVDFLGNPKLFTYTLDLLPVTEESRTRQDYYLRGNFDGATWNDNLVAFKMAPVANPEITEKLTANRYEYVYEGINVTDAGQKFTFHTRDAYLGGAFSFEKGDTNSVQSGADIIINENGVYDVRLLSYKGDQGLFSNVVSLHKHVA